MGGVTLSDLLGTDLVMIPTTSASEIIVVLTWAVTPLDLDLWLVSADNPATATYWDNTGPNDGVRLDKDDTDGYGPEVITLTDTTAAGDYRVAVNVYTSNGEMDCDLESNDICRFAGLETVSFYGSFTPPDSGAQMFSGLIARSIMPRAKVVQENSTTYSQASGLSCHRRPGPPVCVSLSMCLSVCLSVCPRVCARAPVFLAYNVLFTFIACNSALMVVGGHRHAQRRWQIHHQHAHHCRGGSVFGAKSRHHLRRNPHRPWGHQVPRRILRSRHRLYE